MGKEVENDLQKSLVLALKTLRLPTPLILVSRWTFFILSQLHGMQVVSIFHKYLSFITASLSLLGYVVGYHSASSYNWHELRNLDLSKERLL